MVWSRAGTSGHLTVCRRQDPGRVRLQARPWARKHAQDIAAFANHARLSTSFRMPTPARCAVGPGGPRHLSKVLLPPGPAQRNGFAGPCEPGWGLSGRGEELQGDVVWVPERQARTIGRLDDTAVRDVK